MRYSPVTQASLYRDPSRLSTKIAKVRGEPQAAETCPTKTVERDESPCNCKATAPTGSLANQPLLKRNDDRASCTGGVREGCWPNRSSAKREKVNQAQSPPSHSGATVLKRRTQFNFEAKFGAST